MLVPFDQRYEMTNNEDAVTFAREHPYEYVERLRASQAADGAKGGRGPLQKGADGTFTLDLPPLEPGMYWMQYDYDAGIVTWIRTT